MDILRHPRILPLSSTTCQHGCPSILTPWQTNGSVVEFLLNTPDANRERIVSRIEYLRVYPANRRLIPRLQALRKALSFSNPLA